MSPCIPAGEHGWRLPSRLTVALEVKGSVQSYCSTTYDTPQHSRASSRAPDPRTARAFSKIRPWLVLRSVAVVRVASAIRWHELGRDSFDWIHTTCRTILRGFLGRFALPRRRPNLTLDTASKKFRKFKLAVDLFFAWAVPRPSVRGAKLKSTYMLALTSTNRL